MIGITETWFNTSYTYSIAKIDGYSQLRNDRESNIGGGIAFHVKKKIAYCRTTDLESSGLIESLWLEITFNKSPSLLLCTAYRPPDFNAMARMNLFEVQLENAYLECKEIIVMGDFNVHLLSLEENFVSWLEGMNLFSLKQIIEEPTRITPCTASLIDHIYVSNPERVQVVKVSKISISDHFSTTFVYKASSVNKQCHFVTKFRSFKNFDEALFLND